jgi:hypothetical protein
MKTPQHLFALTKQEQGVALLIIFCLLLGAGLRRYQQTAGAPPKPVPAQTSPNSKVPADENLTEEE